MHRHLITASALAFVSVISLPLAARASDSTACGGVDLSAYGECHFEWSAGCQGSCDPASFTLTCNGQCNGSASVACSTECHEQCVTSCTIDPGQFDCNASCVADCVTRSDTECGCNGERTTEIETSCTAECQAQCELVPPSAACDTQCDACCNGSCDVEANVNCNLDCVAELEGGCNLDCQGSGALFCDGQYVPIADYDSCAADLEAQIYGYGSGSGSGSGSGQASFSFGCSLGRLGSHGGAWSTVLLGLGLLALRRRSR
jgi:hypothetical protein